MPGIPRRTCPACARRYAGLVDAACVVCQGLGTLNLGNAALHYYPAPAVARAVELHLEGVAANATHTQPPNARAQVLEAAVDELRAAGVLAGALDGVGTPAGPLPPIPTVTLEASAHHYAAQLGADTADPTLLDAGPRTLRKARPTRTDLPALSANGHPAHLAQVADPIDTLGPDGWQLAAEHRRTDWTAAAITASVPTAAARRRKANA